MKNFTVVFLALLAAAVPGSPTEITLRRGPAGSVAGDVVTTGQMERYAGQEPSDDEIPFEEVWNLPITGFPQAPYTVGVCVVGTELWVTSGGGGSNPAVISVYNLNNTPPTLITRLNQPVFTTGWGMLDMAYSASRDEVYATGPGERELLVIDGSTRALKSRLTLPLPAPSELRTMALDENDSLYTMQQTDPVVKFSQDAPHNPRKWMNILPPTHSGFGAAIDRANGYMWFYNQTQGDPNKLVRFDWPTMANRKAFPVTGASVNGGGCEMWGSDYLIVLDQNEPNDVVRCLRVARYAKDLGVSAFERPTYFGEFPETFKPRAEVRNYGTTSQSGFKVRCLILDEDMVEVYDETLEVTEPLARAASRWLDFPAWESPLPGEDYRAYFTTLLEDDENKANDQVVRVFPVSLSLECRWDDIRNPASPPAGRAWNSGGNGWLHAFPNYWGEVYITATKIALHPASWPVPGGTQYRVIIRDNTGPDGAPGTELRSSGTLTGTRGAWNTHTLPVSIPYSGNRWYVEYNQVGNYPNCPGLATDAERSSPAWWPQWQRESGVFSQDGQTWTDWGIRCQVVKPAVRDVGVTAISRPSAVVVEGGNVYPRMTVYNYGNVGVGPFQVRCIITKKGSTEPVYDRSEAVMSLAPGTSLNFEFKDVPWVAGPVGDFSVLCSTELTGDVVPENDKKALDFMVVPMLRDVGVAWVMAPTGTIAENTRLYPKMRVQNYGNVAEGPFSVRCVITRIGSSIPVYDRREEVPPLEAGTWADIEFKTSPWIATPVGRFQVRCSTELALDELNLNDWCDETFKVSPTWPVRWREAATMPAEPSSEMAKSGAWLAIGPDTGLGDRVIYAGKGNKTTDFYRYYPFAGINGTWQQLEPIPAMYNGREKPPSKGTRGVSDGVSAVYLTHGNNTLGFWRYDIATDTWEPLEEVPLGSYEKKVKGGEDMVYVQNGDTGWIYLLKGYYNEFYRYNTVSGKWDESLPEVPWRVKQRYDRGSFLVYDDARKLIYAHQAKQNDGANHYMFKFDLTTLTWDDAPVKGMPVIDIERGRAKRKRSKDGAAGALYDGKLFALKGGSTVAFYRCDLADFSWTRLTDMPVLGSTGKKKRVGSGADLVYLAERAFFALKGNKTLEFYRYVEPPADNGLPSKLGGSGIQDLQALHPNRTLRISPNPVVSGTTTLRLLLPKPGPVSVTIYDIAGRSVLHKAYRAGRSAHSVGLDLCKLASGVYLVKLDANGLIQTQKLVIQK